MEEEKDISIPYDSVDGTKKTGDMKNNLQQPKTSLGHALKFVNIAKSIFAIFLTMNICQNLH